MTWALEWSAVALRAKLLTAIANEAEDERADG